MKDQLNYIDWDLAWFGVAENALPMSWNLFLAFIPLGLTCLLFYKPKSKIFSRGLIFLLVITFLPSINRFFQFFVRLPIIISVLITAIIALVIFNAWILKNLWLSFIFWIIGCGVFILFLPNAAYILTDIVHLVIDIRKGYPMGVIVLILLPQYLLFIITGWQAYVLSIMNVAYWLNRQGWKKYIIATELGLNFLSAIGVYLGRFLRFNSWDIFHRWDNIQRQVLQIFISPNLLLNVLILFLIFSFLYWLFKRINIGFILQSQ